MAKLMTQDVFIDRCKLKFGNKFDYSKVEYKNAHTKIIVGCEEHGWFLVTPWRHYINKTGCRKCGYTNKIGYNICGLVRNKKTTEEFVNQAKKIHGDTYNYDKSVYVNCSTKIEIQCNRHGVFWQTPSNHLWGNGCPKCRNLYTQKEFIDKCNKIHSSKYDYSNVVYNHNRDYITIICPIHKEFKQKAGYHICGKGCPMCNDSKGEREIGQWLEKNQIEYIPQKEFDDCINPKTKYKLKYDFYLPKENVLIEYDGKQHFVINTQWTKETDESFKNRQFKDEMKTKYAKSKGIELIRISYKHRKTISKILKKRLIIL